MKKKLVKQIAHIAAEMPSVTMLTIEKHFVKGSDMIFNGQTELKNGTKVVADKVYVNPLPVILEVNHKRRMKKLVKKYGTAVIPNYIAAVEQHLEQKQA